ncbi:hypothetical protein RMATCC62417_03558 [Rhizopus microsporus]|nr:hypothetical protein RMATCC62417_03558 [Rhizopus microsporus]
MSSMDLDSSLDDLIKQRKTHPKKGSSQPNKVKKFQKGKEKGNLSIQTKAKVKKPASNNNVKTNKSIMSRLSLTSRLNPPTSNKTSTVADPSKIIITKAVPQTIKGKLGSQVKKLSNTATTTITTSATTPLTKKKAAIVNNINSPSKSSNGSTLSIFSSRLGPRSQQTQPVIPQQTTRITGSAYERPVIDGRSSISIRGRSNVTPPSSGLTIKGESGPTTVLISGLDRGANSEDVRCVCEEFGNVLRCEVLRNRMGESFGEAEVEFSTKSAALDCIAKLDNIKADGQYLRVILRDNKPSTRSYAATQINSIISTPSTSSGRLYSDQISSSRYGAVRR